MYAKYHIQENDISRREFAVDDENMEALFREYKAYVDKCKVLRDEYESSQRIRDELFQQIAFEMNCDMKLLDMLNDVHASNATEKNLEDVLVVASRCGNIELVQLCLDNDATDDSFRAIRQAASNGHDEIMKLLRNKFHYTSC